MSCDTVIPKPDSNADFRLDISTQLECAALYRQSTCKSACAGTDQECQDCLDGNCPGLSRAEDCALCAREATDVLGQCYADLPSTGMTTTTLVIVIIASVLLATGLATAVLLAYFWKGSSQAG